MLQTRYSGVMGYFLNRKHLSMILGFIVFLSMCMKVAGQCPSSWVYYPTGGHCYQYFSSNVTQTVAKGKCDDVGANLVSIWSKEENDFLKNEVIRGQAWIGLERSKKEDPWTWLNGTGPDRFSNWDSFEPGPDEKCARIKPSGSWFGIECDREFSWVCKKEATNMMKDVTSSKTTTMKNMSTSTTSTAIAKKTSASPSAASPQIPSFASKVPTVPPDVTSTSTTSKTSTASTTSTVRSENPNVTNQSSTSSTSKETTSATSTSPTVRNIPPTLTNPAIVPPTSKGTTLATDVGSSGQPPTVNTKTGNSNDDQDKVLIYAIVGGVVGLVIIIVIIVLLVYIWRMAKNRNEKPEEKKTEDTNHPNNNPQGFNHAIPLNDNVGKTSPNSGPSNGKKSEGSDKCKEKQLRKGQAYEPMQIKGDVEALPKYENVQKKPDSQVQVNVIVNMNSTTPSGDATVKNDNLPTNSDMPRSEPPMASKEAPSKPAIASNKPQLKPLIAKKPKLPSQTSTENIAKQEEQGGKRNEEEIEELYAKPMKKKPSQPVPEVTLLENQIYNS